MKKYIFLYNIDSEDYFDKEMIKKLDKAQIDCKIKDYGIIFGDRITEGDSIWVEENQYLMAWTLLNHNEILGFHLFNDIEDYIVQDGLDWLNRHKENDIYVSVEG